MKATGIVRRIDDLGRVVIPKEIRRTMRIREGDPLEIYTDREGEVIFKKYSPIGELTSFAGQYAESLHRSADLCILICDRDSVIATAGVPKKEFSDKRISKELERLMEKRSFYKNEKNEEMDVTYDGSQRKISSMMPIITEGDVVGAVISLFKDEALPSSKPSFDVETKLIQTAASFLGKQLEN